jgi:predicted amidohydrolase
VDAFQQEYLDIFVGHGRSLSRYPSRCQQKGVAVNEQPTKLRAMKYCFVALLILACACDGATEPTFETGACEQFGVFEPVAVPQRCGIDVAGDGESVRVFAVGPVIRYAEMEDYATFCKAWDDVVRTEVLPCLAKDKPNLLVFPENASLSSAFIGSRGAVGRAETATLPAFLSLAQSYLDPILYYAQRYPDLSLGERLVLGVTDTMVRAFQTFPSIAERYGVYVAVSSDFASADFSQDPADIEVLADPDLDSVSGVYVATEGAAYNWGLYFGPDGREIARVAKSYLVPDEEDLLGLSHGPLSQMRPVQLPFAQSGMVISKDAWMPGLLHRLDALGANLNLQPEAFSGWAVEEYEGDWLPDIVRQSAWAHTQRHGSFRHTVTPCIKGNLLDLVFDCQSHVTSPAQPDDPLDAFIGQNPYHGLLAVEPWVIEDPGPPLSLEERRDILRDRGERMLPGSGDPLEDAYVGHVIAADLSLPPDGRVPASDDGDAGALGPSTVIAAPRIEPTHQRFPALAADTNGAVVAWMEGQPGQEVVRAFLTDDAIHFDEIAVESAPNTVQRLPRAATGAGRTALVWEEELGDGAIQVAVMTRVDQTWTRSTLTDPTIAPAWEPDVAIDPVTGRLFATWLDLRAGGRPKPWIARSDDGQTWQALQVDPANDIADNPRGDAAFVRVAAGSDEVYVAFSDFREFSWDVYLSQSADGGQTFEPASRIDPTAQSVVPVSGGDPVESERIHGDVSLAVGPSGDAIVAWSEHQDRRYESRIRVWRGGDTARADDAPDGIDAWRPSVIANAGGEVLAVWQDLRDVTNTIRMATAIDGLVFTPSVRIDDAGSGAHSYGPRIATLAERTLIVWEDTRSGYARVRMVASN